MGLTRHVTVPVSAGLLVDVDRYFDALGAFRSGDIAPIVERFVAASFAALGNGRQLVADLRAVRTDWTESVTARRDSAAWRVLDLVLQHPVVDAELVSRHLGVQKPNVYRSLAPLLEAGVLVESTDKRRDRQWRAPDVLAALDAFAGRAGRRTRPA